MSDKKIAGRISVIKPTEQVTATFQKREIVIEYAENPQYPEMILLQAVQDKCGMFDAYSVGDIVTISYNLRGRKWTDPQGVDKYFNTLQAWKIEKSAVSGVPQNEPQNEPYNNIPEDDTDDLPF